MKFCEVFDKTLIHFNLSAKEISQASGMREATISEYRRGLRQIHTDSLERLIQVLPPKAQEHFFLNCFIEELNDDAIATMLHAIASKLRTSAQKKPYEDEKVPA